MDSKLYIHRAQNEIKLAGIIFAMSEEPGIQKETFKVNDPETYYSAVIAHSYYSIFYGAKAYLAKKGIEVSAPEEHKKAYEEFRRFVETGELDVELQKSEREQCRHWAPPFFFLSHKKKRILGEMKRALVRYNFHI